MRYQTGRYTDGRTAGPAISSETGYNYYNTAHCWLSCKFLGLFYSSTPNLLLDKCI